MQGTITSLTPLKISIGDGLECALTLKSGAVVTRILEGNLRDVKPGDTLEVAFNMDKMHAFAPETQESVLNKAKA